MFLGNIYYINPPSDEFIAFCFASDNMLSLGGQYDPCCTQLCQYLYIIVSYDINHYNFELLLHIIVRNCHFSVKLLQFNTNIGTCT